MNYANLFFNVSLFSDLSGNTSCEENKYKHINSLMKWFGKIL